MSYANYHTHCRFCDGEGEPEQFVKQAIDFGFKSVGFSSHAPIPIYESWVMREEVLDEYCIAINSLKEKYKGIIDINLGMEIDYNPEAIGNNYERFSSLKLDYVIGAVHIMIDKNSKKHTCVDGSKEDFEMILNEFCSGDIKQLISKYYSLLRGMVNEIKPNIIAHFDLVKKHNKNNDYYCEDEAWYKNEVAETLKVIKENKTIIEVNTGAIAREYLTSMYPSNQILTECKKMDIPIILSSDAHKPKHLKFYFDQAVEILKDIGYSKQTILYHGNWVTVDL